MALPAPLQSSLALREHLRLAAGYTFEYGPAGDQGARQGAGERAHGRTHAAVLIAIVERSNGLQLVLTQRTAHLSAHAGQISFPGGRMEPEDVNASATALREAQEEIGLPPANVDVLGGLRTYDTVTGFRVHPIVGWIAQPAEYNIDPNEVDEVFEVPLDFVVDKLNHRREFRMRDGEKRYFFAIPYQERYIWGATAGMLVGFAQLLHTDFSAQAHPENP